MGGAPQVQAPQAPNAGVELGQAIQGYVANAPALYGEEAQFQPQYNQLQQGLTGSNINFYSGQLYNQMPQAQNAAQGVQGMASQFAQQQLQNLGPGVSQATLASSPQLQALAAQGQQQLGAGATADQTLANLQQNVLQQMPGQQQGFMNLAAQAGQQLQPINQQLQGLTGQLGADTTAAQMGSLAQQVQQNARSDIFNQTKANVMGNLGSLDPLTQQLQTTAQSQLALGGGMSPQMAADVAQQQRAAYSARGMLNTSGSIGAEIMGQQQVQQQLLGQREQFASGVSGLVQSEQQQRTANALGLTGTDIAATQANQQLAGNLYQGAAGVQQANIGLQAGLQGQIAGNLQNVTAQQAALQQQALAAYQGGITNAAGIQQAILGQQNTQQQMGAQNLASVYGAQQGNLGAILGAPAQGLPLGQTAQQFGMAAGTGAPSLFQSSGMLSLVNQNQMAQMNANAAANQMNAQSRGNAQGAMIGAGGALIGSLAVGGILL